MYRLLVIVCGECSHEALTRQVPATVKKCLRVLAPADDHGLASSTTLLNTIIYYLLVIHPSNHLRLLFGSRCAGAAPTTSGPYKCRYRGLTSWSEDLLSSEHCRCEVSNKNVATVYDKRSGGKEEGSGSVNPAQYIIRRQLKAAEFRALYCNNSKKLNKERRSALLPLTFILLRDVTGRVTTNQTSPHTRRSPRASKQVQGPPRPQLFKKYCKSEECGAEVGGGGWGSRALFQDRPELVLPRNSIHSSPRFIGSKARTPRRDRRRPRARGITYVKSFSSCAGADLALTVMKRV
ncbi:hypothetical protein EVAR_85548_1 [Eumeta japonica]|uniref:Uncharacterized protein n=1 Tax=Eumeta variegata TaxID=151549 RepID=A0A4C1VCF0_EUMVA|nr:hypothetical protein EVAR_85548_1 [Eumeta japonica]